MLIWIILFSISSLISARNSAWHSLAQYQKSSRDLSCYPVTGKFCTYTPNDQLHCASNGQNYRNRCIFNCMRMRDNSLTLRSCAARTGDTTCTVRPVNTATCPTAIVTPPPPTTTIRTTTTTKPTTKPTTNPTIRPLPVCSSQPSTSLGKRKEVLDPAGKFIVEWEADMDKESIRFDVTVETYGYIGFGISKNKNLNKADLIIGGVTADGKSYFDDYYSVSNKFVLDKKPNWCLISATESAGKTKLSFYRDFNSCEDAEDEKITEDTLKFVWFFGTSDTINLSAPVQGYFNVLLLDPPNPEFNPANFQSWRLSRVFEMPANDFTFWCDFQKRPAMTQKNHIVAFEPYFGSKDAIKYVKQIIIYNCPAVGKNQDEVFGPYMGKAGNCYERPTPLPPMENCQAFELVWSKGGGTIVMPAHSGIPLNQDNDDQYFMLNIKYENPDLVPGISVDAGVNVYYTNQLRTNDAGMMEIGEVIDKSHLVPPNAVNWKSAAHCPSRCTTEKLPATGITYFNTVMYAQKSARTLRLRHFRAGKELPWIINDANADFEFIVNRPMRKEITILPGDHIIYECIADTTFRNGNVSINGENSYNDELYKSWAYYYPRIDFGVAASKYGGDVLKYFGIDEAINSGKGLDMTVTAPDALKGKTLMQVVGEVNWTPTKRQEFENELRLTKHWGFCTGVTAPLQLLIFEDAVWPEFDKDYVPISKKQCPA